MNIRQMLGNRIDVFKKQHGYSSLDVAKLVGVGHSTVSSWISGRTLPSFNTIKKMNEVGIDTSGIEGIPSPQFCAREVKDFCKKYSIKIPELANAVDIATGLIYRFIDPKVDTTNLESLFALENFIKQYKVSYTGEEEEGVIEMCADEAKEEVVEEVADELPFVEPIEMDDYHIDVAEIPAINDIQEDKDTEEPEEKKITLRELLALADKFNIMDAEIGANGGMKIIGFRVVIGEDMIPHLVLKVW